MTQSMSQFLLGYLPLVVFIGVATVIGLVLLTVAFLVAYKAPDPEKLSAYECGFNAFDDARMKFDIRFYLVAILFIIFDLEVSFLFPWAAAFGQLGVYGFWSMMLFLAVLTIGFIYEWKKGALEWDGANPQSQRQARVSSTRGPASRWARTIRFSASSTASLPTRDSSLRRPTTSSPGRAPAR